MPLTIEEVEHIAHLARLHLTEEEKTLYREQLSSILDHVAKLQALDTDDVSAMSSIVVDQSPLREDEIGECLEPEKLLRNAPQAEENQFRVPPVLDNPH